MSRTPRRGVALVMTVACMATLALIAAAMLQGILVARHQFRAEQHLRQVKCLLDAGVGLARTRLARADAIAAGGMRETVDVPASEIVGTSPGRISLTAQSEGNDRWRLTVVAEYPIEGAFPVRRTRETSLVVPAIESPPFQEKIP